MNLLAPNVHSVFDYEPTRDTRHPTANPQKSPLEAEMPAAAAEPYCCPPNTANPYHMKQAHCPDFQQADPVAGCKRQRLRAT